MKRRAASVSMRQSRYGAWNTFIFFLITTGCIICRDTRQVRLMVVSLGCRAETR
jgi:hypothetical protein